MSVPKVPVSGGTRVVGIIGDPVEHSVNENALDASMKFLCLTCPLLYPSGGTKDDVSNLKADYVHWARMDGAFHA